MNFKLKCHALFDLVTFPFNYLHLLVICWMFTLLNCCYINYTLDLKTALMFVCTTKLLLYSLKSTSSLHHQQFLPTTVSRSGSTLWITSWLWLPEEKVADHHSHFPQPLQGNISADGSKSLTLWTNINFKNHLKNQEFIGSIHTCLAWLHSMQYMFSIA